MTRVIRAARATQVITRRVLEARSEASQIIRDAERARESIRRATVEEAQAQAAAALLRVAGQRDTALKDAQTELEHAAVAATERLLRTALELRPEVVRAIITDVLDRVRSAKVITLRVHPSDEADALGTAQAHAASRAIRVVADEAITRGGCVVSSELGSVDATVETRLLRLREAISPRDSK